MVIDVITFNGEKELFEIRYNILKDFVDEFIVCEAPTTFSGKPKPLYFKDIQTQYPKVKYFVIDENYTKEEIEQAVNSPNTKGAEHWKREFMQKESIKKALTHLHDNDLVFIGDCDEVWNPNEIPTNFASAFFRKLSMRVYSYYLNNFSNEEFYGTLVGFYGYIKKECLNHIRSTSHQKTSNGGWHFTSMGGYEEVKRKLSDSYTRESYWTEQVENNLKHNVESSKDFLGRGFTYSIDESNWPQYLKDNKQKYAHLLR